MKFNKFISNARKNQIKTLILFLSLWHTYAQTYTHTYNGVGIRDVAKGCQIIYKKIIQVKIFKCKRTCFKCINQNRNLISKLKFISFKLFIFLPEICCLEELFT